MIRLFALLAVLSGPALAQGQPVQTGTGIGAILRTLDRVSGEVVDVEMASGQTMAYGTLQVTLHECRFPANNPSGDAFALLQVVDARAVEELFAGWMVASSPALNALEHARYDIWTLRCLRQPGAEAAPVDGAEPATGE
ncbi:MAG: DUF2155 domain-containing protein [Pseudomonadota bacterium]